MKETIFKFDESKILNPIIIDNLDGYDVDGYNNIYSDVEIILESDLGEIVGLDLINQITLEEINKNNIYINKIKKIDYHNNSTLNNQFTYKVIEDTILINKGHYVVDSTIIFPKNSVVVISSGTVIEIMPNQSKSHQTTHHSK